MAFGAKAAVRDVLAAAAAVVLAASIVAAASVSRHAEHSASRYAVQVTAGPAGGHPGACRIPGP